MLIATFLVISQLPIEVSSFPLLGKSVITHFTKASLLFYSFLQASKDHMSSGMRNLRTLFDLASDWLMEKWSVLISREKISRD